MTSDAGRADAEKPVRVDSWLWSIRIYKTRSAATTACRAGHVRVNGERTKAAQTVKPGDEVRVRMSGFDRILIVRKTLSKRVGAPVAATAIDDRTPPREPGAMLAVRASSTRAGCSVRSIIRRFPRCTRRASRTACRTS